MLLNAGILISRTMIQGRQFRMNPMRKQQCKLSSQLLEKYRTLTAKAAVISSDDWSVRVYLQFKCIFIRNWAFIRKRPFNISEKSIHKWHLLMHEYLCVLITVCLSLSMHLCISVCLSLSVSLFVSLFIRKRVPARDTPRCQAFMHPQIHLCSVFWILLPLTGSTSGIQTLYMSRVNSY